MITKRFKITIILLLIVINIIIVTTAISKYSMKHPLYPIYTSIYYPIVGLYIPTLSTLAHISIVVRRNVYINSRSVIIR